MSDQVPESEKTERCGIIMELGKRLSRRCAERMIGSTAPVLAESKQGELLSGFTDNYVETKFAGDESLRGRIMPVRLIEVMGYGKWVMGELV